MVFFSRRSWGFYMDFFMGIFLIPDNDNSREIADTLILKSPTATPRDRLAVEDLAILAGVNYDESVPGYKHILFAPVPLGSDYEASYKYASLYGEISSSVSRKGDLFTLEVMVPVGCTATVNMPYSGEVHEIGQGTYKYTTKAR